MTNAWRASEVGEAGHFLNASPLVGEEGARAKRGKVRGNADGLTKRQTLPALTVVRSRENRKRMGEPERRMWTALREAFPGIRFRRQVPFGPYHADFCAHAAKLVIEIDGDDHAERIDKDNARTRFLEGEGYTVLRFGNGDVMGNIEGVIAKVTEHLASPLVGEGGAERRMRGTR